MPAVQTALPRLGTYSNSGNRGHEGRRTICASQYAQLASPGLTGNRIAVSGCSNAGYTAPGAPSCAGYTCSNDIPAATCRA